MDEPLELRHNRYWRIAVWALRVGYLGLIVVLAGVVVLSSGSTPWVLAAGVFIWLGAATFTLTGFFRVRRELSDPKPGYWPMRWMLLHDTFRSRSSADPSP